MVKIGKCVKKVNTFEKSTNYFFLEVEYLKNDKKMEQIISFDNNCYKDKRNSIVWGNMNLESGSN
jgi:hypothetical protein